MGAALLLGAACGETLQPVYRIEILSGDNDNPFTGADRVDLEIGSEKRVSRTIQGGGSFDLSLTGFRPRRDQVAELRLTAYAGQALVAQGKSPPIELQLGRAVVAILVQRPGTLVRRSDALPLRLQQVGVTSAAARGGASSFVTPVLFGGATIGVDQNLNQFTGTTARVLLYNPVLHLFLDGLVAAQPRAGAGVLTTASGIVVAFGGFTGLPAPRLSGVLDSFELARTDPISVAIAPRPPRASEAPELPRAAPVLVELDAVYALGGLGNRGAPADEPLDSVVRIDLVATDAARALTLLPARMAVARHGHTVTRVIPRSGVDAPTARAALVFGGAATGPVAELMLTTPTPAFVPLEAPGGPRGGHAALPLVAPGAVASGGEPVLIVGGSQVDADAPGGVRALGDMLLYDPAAGTFTELPVRLAQPRWAAAVFLAGRELVVLGGLTAPGSPTGRVERFLVNLSGAAVDLAPLPELTGHARYGMTAAALPDGTFLISGGSEIPEGQPDGAREVFPSAMSELYRPAH